MFPKSGTPMEIDVIFRALLSISFGVPSRGALPPGSPHRAPSEGDAPFLEPSFIHLSTSPVYEPPSKFPRGAPMGRDAVSRAFIYTSSRVPSKGTSFPGFPNRSPAERNAPYLEPPFTISQKPQ